jgi:3-oxoacyl-[acyl-carrier protein] reductase
MSETANKVAIVTGASRGIGAAVAERLARDGFAVVVNYAGQAAPAEALVGRIEAVGGRALPVQADVSDPAAVRRMFDAAEAALGGVDVLVNNAGIMILSTVAKTEDAVLDRQIAVNLKGTFNTLREAATRLRSGCAPAAASSISHPASPACCSQPTLPTPRPRQPWRR